MMLIGKQHIGSDKETGMKRIIHALFILLILSSMFSCKHREPEKISVYRYDKYIDDNFEKYGSIRSAVIDTLNEWTLDSLDATRSIFYGACWEVDSLFLFNKDSVRFFTTLNLISCNRKDTRTDWIQGLMGIKSKGKWFFQFGSNHIIGRAGRIRDKYIPLTAEQISYVAHNSPNIMGRFLQVDEGGDYTVDYDELHAYFYKSYRSSYPDIEKIDSLILTRIAAYHKKKIDPKEIDRIKESVKNSVRPPKVPKPKKSFIRRLFEEEEKTPLFETAAWKNRRKRNDDKR